MDTVSKFKFSASEGIIELEGSEAFVSKQLEELRELIVQLSQTSLTKVPVKYTVAEPSPSSEERPSAPGLLPTQEFPPIAPADSSGGLSSYPNTFEDMNGTLRIVADIPGESTKSKMRNVALIYGYGCVIQNKELFPADAVRQVCQDHGCLDGGNFSKIFTDKTTFVVEGVKGGNKTIKLSFQGRKQAKHLIESIEANAS